MRRELRQHPHDPNAWLSRRVGALGVAKLDQLARAVRLALDV